MRARTLARWLEPDFEIRTQFGSDAHNIGAIEIVRSLPTCTRQLATVAKRQLSDATGASAAIGMLG